MGTRSLYTFKDSDGQEFHVYKHWDGYPSSALPSIRNMQAYCWTLPRFEADEASAAFIAANKGKGGGDIRLMKTGDWKTIAPHDIEYRYVICQPKAGKLVAIEAYQVYENSKNELVQKKCLGIALNALFKMSETEIKDLCDSKNLG